MSLSPFHLQVKKLLKLVFNSSESDTNTISKNKTLRIKAVIICSCCHSGSLKNQSYDIAVKTR